MLQMLIPIRLRSIQGLCLFLALSFALSSSLSAQSLKDYLGDWADASFDSNVPTPQDFLGWMPGKWHVDHSQLVAYMQALDASSERVEWQEYARSWEDRPLGLLVCTDPANQNRLEEIRTAHLASLQAEDESENSEAADWLVIYQGFSVHGNEASGSNAALLYAYFLAACEDEDVQNMLRESVVLIDPCLNPDGLHRFAGWVNMNKSRRPDPAGWSREHNETWPGGRTNHYWFDLNRDWMPLIHPESRGRVEQFYRWRPQVVTDHHEMGSASTFFFQPGIPSRTHPLTPQKNQDLTSALAEYHADALEEIGSRFYTKQSFDDFYYGKGSTFPDIQGSVGILFEQASARGHFKEGSDAPVSFPFAVRNQLRAAMGTLLGSHAISEDLIAYQKDFVADSKDWGRQQKSAYLIGDDGDIARLRYLAQLLDRHQISYSWTANDYKKGDTEFIAGRSISIPLQQSQGRFIEALFESRTSFSDSLFYDVSAWNMAMAMDLPLAKIDLSLANELSGDGDRESWKPERNPILAEAYGWIFRWNHMDAPILLNRLLEAGYTVKVAQESFQVDVATNNRGSKVESFEPGTMLVFIPRREQYPSIALDQKPPLDLFDLAQRRGVECYTAMSGLAEQGIDLGSPSMLSINPRKLAMLVGDRVSSYAAGSVWHSVDVGLQAEMSIIPQDNLSRNSLAEYDVLIMPSGSFQLEDSQQEALKNWIRDGGQVISFGRAAFYLSDIGVHDLERVSSSSEDKKEVESTYAELDRKNGAKALGGAIFQAEYDPTHPLSYGMGEGSEMAVFMRGNSFFKTPENVSDRVASPIRLTSSNALLAGYVHPESLDGLQGSAYAYCAGYGSGRIISFVADTQFRGFWLGTRRLFYNAIFLGQSIDRSSLSYKEASEEEAEDEHQH
jgi:hypothetical protein